MHYNTIKRVKYECSYVYIIINSGKEFFNGIKGIFNKLVSLKSRKGMFVVTKFEYILWELTGNIK